MRVESGEQNGVFEITEDSAAIENDLTRQIIGAAIEVHRHLGPGLLESAYEECLCFELSALGLRFKKQIHSPLKYKGVQLDCGYRIDVLVDDAIIVEIKAVESVLPIHRSQLLTYLKASDKRVGLLLNFNVTVLKDGISRVVNHYTGPALEPAPISSSSLPPSLQSPDSISDSSSPRKPPRLRVSALKKEPS